MFITEQYIRPVISTMEYTTEYRQQCRDFELICNRIEELEQKYKERFWRELVEYNGKLYLKDMTNAVYSTNDPDTKVGIYVNKIMTFCNMEEELLEDVYN